MRYFPDPSFYTTWDPKTETNGLAISAPDCPKRPMEMCHHGHHKICENYIGLTKDHEIKCDYRGDEE